MAYTFEQVLAVDPSNPANVARAASITIFAPGDAAKTPLTLTDTNGSPLANPLTVNANGFGPAFIHDTLDRVAWEGGGFTGFLTSYEGMKEEAVAARAAAETAAATAGAEATAIVTAATTTVLAEAENAATSAETAAAAAQTSANAAVNAAALIGAPADTAIAAAINGNGETKTALETKISAALEELPTGTGANIRLDALAAGQRLRAITAGNQAETAKGVTVGAMRLQSDTAAGTGASLGSVTLLGASDKSVNTTAAHLLAVGDPVALTGITTTTGISNNTIYYVREVLSATKFTLTATPGGTLQNFSSDGTATNLYKRNRSWDRVNSVPHPALRITETRPVQALGTTPRWDYIKPDPTIITYAPGVLTGTNMRVEVEYSGKYIDILLRYGGGNRARIYVDGLLAYQVTSVDFTTAGVSSGSNGRLPLTFIDARKRSIMVEFDSASDEFPGFDIQAGYFLAYPTGKSKGPRVLISGDSFSEGTGAGTSPSYIRWVGWHMGWLDVWKGGSGGTGYTADGTRLALIDRYTNDIVAQQAQIVIISMGINDQTTYASTPATVLADAATIWDATLASSYTKELIIIGPWPNGGGTGVSATLIDMDAQLHTMAKTRSIRYISPIQEGWTFTLSDATHPDAAGHEYIGWRVAGHLSVPYLETS